MLDEQGSERCADGTPTWGDHVASTRLRVIKDGGLSRQLSLAGGKVRPLELQRDIP